MNGTLPWIAGTVDARCINCDAARQLAPELIVEAGGRSQLLRSPSDEVETQRLYAAVFACPTRSIRPASGQADQVLDPFPMALDEGVLLCGHNSPQTAGADSYLLLRPSGTLMMIDTPRWSRELAKRYSDSGLVTDVLLTHRDHAAHGGRYADHFGARLWIHEGDLDAAPDADQVIHGLEPLEIGEGVTAQPLPGHTRGSVLYLGDDRYCFSGDSFYWSRTTGGVPSPSTSQPSAGEGRLTHYRTGRLRIAATASGASCRRSDVGSWPVMWPCPPRARPHGHHEQLSVGASRVSRVPGREWPPRGRRAASWGRCGSR